MPSPQRLYFVAGEVSGDAHGSALMAELRRRQPTLEFRGRGGPKMQALAGADHLEDWCDQAAVVGLWEVLKKYGYFRAQFHRVLAEIEELRPDAVVLIDYPGFNLRLAAELRKRQLPLKIIYYISPQVWAWNRGRIPRMARWLDLMICIFPFEPALYEPAGLKSVFAGHPLIDTLAAEPAAEARDLKLVGLFPGSRQREARKNFPVMLAAAQRLRAARPSLRFAAAAPSERLAATLTTLRQAAGWTDADCLIGVHDSRQLMRRAGAGMVASGTATVEAACLGMPLAIVYRVAWLTYWVGRAVVRVPYLGMINLLAQREIAREFLQSAATPAGISAEMLRLLEDPAARERQMADLQMVVNRLGGGGASERAAEAISATLSSNN